MRVSSLSRSLSLASTFYFLTRRHSQSHISRQRTAAVCTSGWTYSSPEAVLNVVVASDLRTDLLLRNLSRYMDSYPSIRSLYIAVQMQTHVYTIYRSSLFFSSENARLRLFGGGREGGWRCSYRGKEEQTMMMKNQSMMSMASSSSPLSVLPLLSNRDREPRWRRRKPRLFMGLFTRVLSHWWITGT